MRSLNVQRLARRVLVILAIGGVLSLARQVLVLFYPSIYRKDLVQEYLLGRAVLAGVNPYLPQADLAARFLPQAHVQAHPVPHPPFVALLAVPLGLLDFRLASAVWLAVEVVLLAALALLVARQVGGGSRSVLVLGGAALFLWPPVHFELAYGQLTSLLAVLLVGCWLAWRRGRRSLAGLLLGTAVAVKLFPAVLIAYFVVKRERAVALWATGTVAACFALGGVVVGAEGVAAFVREGLVGAAGWRAGEGNYTLFALAWRLLAGTIHIAPVVDLEAAALPVAVLVGLGVVAVALAVASRAGDPEGEYGLMLCATLLASPVAWQYYLVLLVWPVALLVRRVQRDGWPGRERLLLSVSLIGMSVPASAVLALWQWLAGVLPDGAADPRAHPAAGLPLVVLPLGLALLYGLYVARLAGGAARAPGPGRLLSNGASGEATRLAGGSTADSYGGCHRA